LLELSHVQNYDIRLMSLVTVMVGMITLLADILLRTRIRRSRNNDDNLGLVFLLLVLP
jgi:Zn-dependent protease with chaperone function